MSDLAQEHRDAWRHWATVTGYAPMRPDDEKVVSARIKRGRHPNDDRHEIRCNMPMFSKFGVRSCVCDEPQMPPEVAGGL